MFKYLALVALSLLMASPALALAPDSKTLAPDSKTLAPDSKTLAPDSKGIILSKISAKDLAAKAGINLADAKKIVAHRAKTSIKTMKALRAVPGLSKQTGEALKAKLFGFGKGTKSSATAASAKPELL